MHTLAPENEAMSEVRDKRLFINNSGVDSFDLAITNLLVFKS